MSTAPDYNNAFDGSVEGDGVRSAPVTAQNTAPATAPTDPTPDTELATAPAAPNKSTDPTPDTELATAPAAPNKSTELAPWTVWYALALLTIFFALLAWATYLIHEELPASTVIVLVSGVGFAAAAVAYDVVRRMRRRE